MNVQSTKSWIKLHQEQLINFYLFLNFLAWTCWQFYKAITEHRLDFVEGSFLLQNVILTTVVLIRKPQKSMDKNVFNQIIATVAFFSGALFMGQPVTSTGALLNVSTVITITANFFGILTLINLGRSFGILIAVRRVKTKGLYGIIRHPMYGTDILLRIGYITSHLTLFSIVAFVLSTACYIYRAILEEKFLKQQPEYNEYMKKVRYRFIPLIF